MSNEREIERLAHKVEGYYKLALSVLHEVLDSSMSDEEMANVLINIGAYGCEQGLSGLTYYSETTEFFLDHKADIKKFLRETAEEMGIPYKQFLFEMYKRKDCQTKAQRRNIKVWCTVEMIVDRICNH